MLEITKEAIYKGEELYKDLSAEEYYERAAAAARKIVGMIEEYRKNM